MEKGRVWFNYMRLRNIEKENGLSHRTRFHLSTNQIRVEIAILQQLLMCSLSCYYTIVNHEDDITVHNRAQTMRHRHHRTRVSLSPRLQRRQERILFLAVQRTRRLVQKEDRWITKTPIAASDLPIPPFPQLLDRYRTDRASR